jgi:hypothetical protein
METNIETQILAKNKKVRIGRTNAIESISAQLQQELSGLRGFSTSNMKQMRLFYETRNFIVSNRPLPVELFLMVIYTMKQGNLKKTQRY